MADPRAARKLDGIGAQFATFAIDNSTITYDATEENGSAEVGLAVTLNSSETIELVADGEFVLGRLVSVESDNFATVQIGGMMELPGGTSATLTRGSGIVGDLLVAAEGYIRSVATGTAAELGLQNGKIIDPSTTTAVICRF